MIGAVLERPTRLGTADVEAFIEAFFTERATRASSCGDDYLRLWDATRSSSTGGKRLRPELVLAAHAAYAERGAATQRSDAAAVQLAAAFELLHTAFLMHDDVIDHDLERRGAPNVTARFMREALARGVGEARSREYGEAAAILAGDLLISSAHRIVAGLDAAAEVRTALLDVLDECVLLTAAGELADVRQSTASPGPHEIVVMIEQKTAAYSFSGPLRAGAILGGAPARSVASLSEVGRHLGVAFQLRDDVLGVFGSASLTGKTVTGDLREGKQTLLVAFAREHHGWGAVAGDFGRPDLDEEAAARLRTAIVASGALERVETMVGERCAEAVAAIETGGFPEALRDELVATAGRCVERVR